MLTTARSEVVTSCCREKKCSHISIVDIPVSFEKYRNIKSAFDVSLYTDRWVIVEWGNKRFLFYKIMMEVESERITMSRNLSTDSVVNAFFS